MTVKKVLRRFTAAATEIPRIHYREGLESGFRGDYESAIESFDRVNYITIGSSFWTNQSQYFKACAYYELEQYDKAVKEFKKFLETNENETPGWNNLGAAYLEGNKHVDAIPCFEKVIELECKKKNPDEDLLEAAWNNLGTIYLDLIIEIDIKKQHPELPNLHLDAMTADEDRKKFLILLEQCVHEVLKITPEYFDGLDLKRELLWKQDKNNEALEISKNITKLLPTKWESWNSLGVAYSKINNQEESLKYFEKGLKIKPNEDLLWYNKACTLSEMNKVDDALDALFVAISIDPENLLQISDDSDFDNIKNSERFKKFLTIPV